MPWVVVMTKPNCEHIAVANLVQQGFQCYAPRFRFKRPDQTVLIKPLFPRYIFTFIQSFWYCIRGTRGVSYLLMGDNGPQSVPEAVIKSIQSREDGEGYIKLESKEALIRRFQYGDKVRTTEGPLAGKLLVYDGMSSRDRVKVLIAMLGREVPALVREKDLIAA